MFKVTWLTVKSNLVLAQPSESCASFWLELATWWKSNVFLPSTARQLPERPVHLWRWGDSCWRHIHWRHVPSWSRGNLPFRIRKHRPTCEARPPLAGWAEVNKSCSVGFLAHQMYLASVFWKYAAAHLSSSRHLLLPSNCTPLWCHTSQLRVRASLWWLWSGMSHNVHRHVIADVWFGVVCVTRGFYDDICSQFMCVISEVWNATNRIFNLLCTSNFTKWRFAFQLLSSLSVTRGLVCWLADCCVRSENAGCPHSRLAHPPLRP